MHIFGPTAPFFLLDTISTFDAIIGLYLLSQVGAALDLHNNDVNFTNINDVEVPSSV